MKESEQIQYAKRRYFDTLNALRFMAFFCVFLGHTKTSSIPFLAFFQHSGGLAVQFFSH
jgi:peptidoglycan/LPS O-acetylase OafA/YrhL